jgi:versiconal hemiacetal acetate esterase
MGDLEGEDPQVRTISKYAGVVIVSVEYRLLLRIPILPHLVTVAAYYWALENSLYLKTTPNQAFTYGISASGNLALSVALKVIDEGKGDTVAM